MRLFASIRPAMRGRNRRAGREFARLLILLGAGLAAGCGQAAAPGQDLPQELQAAAAALDDKTRQAFLEVRAQQRGALAGVADLLQQSEPKIPDLERGMRLLNDALFAGQRGMLLLRRAGQGKGPLYADLRQGDAEILAAFERLQQQHPNPTPDLLKREGDEAGS